MEVQYRIIQNGSGENFLLKLTERPTGDQKTLEHVWVPIASKVSRDELQRVLSDIEKGERDQNGIKILKERTIHVGMADVITTEK